MSDYISKHLNLDYQHVKDKPHCWIQWKGTDVCIDVHCSCGNHDHFDGEFFYLYECPKCHKKYSVGCNILLHELSDEDVKNIIKDKWMEFQNGGKVDTE